MNIPTKYCGRGDDCQHPQGPILPIAEFHNDRTRRDGKVPYCKACVKKYYADNRERMIETSRKWQKANPEKQKQHIKNYYERNREKIRVWRREYSREYMREYRAKNPDFNREAKRRYRSRHPDRVREQDRQYRAKYPKKIREIRKNYTRRKPDPIKERERHRIWRKGNPAKVRAKKLRRRTKKANLPHSFGPKDEAVALEYFNGRCAVCARPLRDLFGEHYAAMDHWIALTDPRPDNPGTVPENMVPLCHGKDGCNNKKRNHDPEEWLIREYGKRKALEILHRVHTYFQWLKS